MHDPRLLRLGPVALGYPRISVVAVFDPPGRRFDPEVLREAGVSATVGGSVIPDSPVPAADPGAIVWDREGRIALYPGWVRSQDRPWGPLLEGPDTVALALASVVAGAPVVGLLNPDPVILTEVVTELKALAGLLGREFTRIPKRAEGTARKEVPGTGESRRYSGRPGLSVAFQGEHGAFSEMAVFNLFPQQSTQAVPLPSFREVFTAVLAGDVDFGMVPIENALAGPINENYDLLQEFPDLHIVGETQVRVEHNLIGLPGTDLAAVRRVFSHPQGLAQSQQFLKSHPEWESVPFYDTAGSVKHVAEKRDPSLAAIASAEAARVYGMEILVPGVETNHRNFTRFFLITRRSEPGVGTPNKASLVFGTADAPGALSRCLAVFASHGVNMTKLESRPIHGRPWDYLFYVDARLPADPKAFDATVAELGTVAQDLRVLGVYEA
ncbi:MAG TPA: prephenate dehydratase [Spirochaetia bacterium]|jgi:prephenate dehydratase|nr:prephenate dehydratase [Spirochaetia bacterium]